MGVHLFYSYIIVLGFYESYWPFKKKSSSSAEWPPQPLCSCRSSPSLLSARRQDGRSGKSGWVAVHLPG